MGRFCFRWLFQKEKNTAAGTRERRTDSQRAFQVPLSGKYILFSFWPDDEARGRENVARIILRDPLW